MKFRAKIVDAACLNHFTRVSAMIAKLAKTCTLRISPEKLNFVLSDRVASAGVSMWCELEQENFFSEFQMEGISAENNAIYLDLTAENLSRALKTAQNARALKIKLTNKHFPCLTVSIELLSVSSSSRVVTHDIPVKVIPRKLWKDLQEPTIPDSDVSIYLPALKTMKSIVEKMKNISNHLIMEANLSGELNLKIETELVCVTTHFKDLGNPPPASEDASQERPPEQMAEVHIDIRKLLQFLAGQQVNPTRAVCKLHANPVPFTSPTKVSHPPGALTFGEEAQVLENPPPLASWDQDIVKATSRAPLSAASRRSQAASDPGDHTDRESWGPSVTITSFWNSSGPDPCRPRKCAVGPGSSVPCGLLQRSCPPAGPCRLRVRIPSCPSADDVASDVLPGTDVASTAASPGVPVRPAVSAPTSSPTAHPPTLPRSSLGHGGSASWPRPPTRCHPGAVSMHSPPDALDAADHGFPDTDAWAPLSLGFRVRASPKAALCLRVDFGDSSGVQVTIYNVSRGIAVTAYHQFRKGTVVTHHFAAGPPCNVSFTCQSCVAGGQAWPSVTVQYRMQPVSVYTNGNHVCH
uniref:Checkpoint protein HUS1 n=1 Tax=Canis lupus familiaris TaxID=9615 RepID=A0A8I3PX92_CANLF